MFNNKKFNSLNQFCSKCGFSAQKKYSSINCPVCNTLLKIADKNVSRFDEFPGDRKQDHPYRKNDPSKGEGYALTNLGEQDAFGGGNTRSPSSVQQDVSADPRTKKDNYGLPERLPTSTTILDDLDDEGRGDKPTPSGTSKVPKFFDEDSPIGNMSNVNNPHDSNSFQNKLTLQGKDTDLFDRVRRRLR